MFYVYAWYKESNNEIFYIGKGCGKRYRAKANRNKLFKQIVSQYDCNSKILKYFENEKDAFEYEHKLICEYKKKGLCYCNLDNGGVGGCHFIWTDEMRKYYSKYNIMKDPIRRNKMSKNNPMKNPKIVEKVMSKKIKPIYIGETRYSCAQEYSDKFGVKIGTIYGWLQVGHNSTNLVYYEGTKPIEYDFSKDPHANFCIKVKYNNKIYNSIKDVARDLNIKYTTLHNQIKKGKIKIEKL